jgi:hypothetical protein
MTRLRNLLDSFRRCESAIAAVEFALIAPFLILLTLGGFEVSRFILVQQKAEKMAYSVADVIAQYDTIRVAEVNQVFMATEQIMQPYTFGADGVAIISSVYREEADPQPLVRWQCRSSDSMAQDSGVGTVGGQATLPGDLLLDEKDGVIVSEVYYRFTPLFQFVFLDPFVIQRTAVFRPRLGALTTPPGC